MTINERYFRKPESDSIRSKAIKGAGATIYAQIALQSVSVAVTIIMARLLTPSDYGMVTMVNIFVLLLQNFGINGFTETILNADTLDHRQASSLFWIQVFSSSILMTLLMACSSLLAYFYKTPQLKMITIVMSTSILFSGMSTINTAILIRNLQFGKTAIIRLASVVLSGIVAVTLAGNGGGYYSIVTRRVCETFVLVIGAWIACAWRPGLPAINHQIIKMVRYGITIYGNFLLNYFSRNLDKMLIGKFLGPQQLGSYDRAYYLSTLPASQVAAPLSQVGVATLSRLRTEPEKFRKYFGNVLSLLTFSGLFLSTVLSVSGYDLILFLLGPEWSVAGKVFACFSPSIGIIVVYQMNTWLHLSLGESGRLIRWNLFSFLLVLCGYCIGLPFGAIGVAVAYSVSYIWILVPSIWYAGRPLRMTWHEIVAPMWKYFLSWLITVSFFMIAYTKIPFFHHHMGSFPVVARIMIYAFSSGALYLLIVVTIHGGIDPIMNFIRIAKEMAPFPASVKRA